MENSTRVELPILESSKILLKHHTIGDLQKTYSNLLFVKYIYKDPEDGKLKGANPLGKLPLVANSFITIAGKFDDILVFTNDLVDS